MLFTPNDLLDTSNTFAFLQGAGILVAILAIIGVVGFWCMDELSRGVFATLLIVALAGGAAGTLSGIREHELRTAEHAQIAQTIHDTYGLTVSDEVVRSLLTVPPTSSNDDGLRRLSDLVDGGPAQMREDFGTSTFYDQNKEQMTVTLSWISDEWQLTEQDAETVEISRNTTTDEETD